MERGGVRLVRFGGLVHVFAVVLDEILDPLAALPGVGTGVFDGAAEAYVVTHEILARWIGLQLLDVGLFDFEVS